MGWDKRRGKWKGEDGMGREMVWKGLQKPKLFMIK
jgi:hypothetical protein